jgi:predicted MPP superfamily phosphohydrolase
MVVPSSSSLVTWIYTKDDERVGRELVRFAGVLAKLGVIRNRELDSTRTAESLLTQRHIVDGELAVFLVSPAALDDQQWQYSLRDALRERGPRVVLVLVRAINLQELPVDARRIVLPKDGTALAGRRDGDEAMLDVIETIREIATIAPVQPTAPLEAQAAPQASKLSIHEIFSLHGTPSVTFVEPPRFRELQLELSTMGTGLILEGPSKTGKSTAVHKAMEALGIVERKHGSRSSMKSARRKGKHAKAEPKQMWWDGRKPWPLDEFQRFLDGLVETTEDRWLVIDDFHYLEDPAYRKAIAFTAKTLADQPRSHAKIILIGINPLGQALLQVTPDLAGRFRIMHLHQDLDWERSSRISELIVLGERAANIRFLRREEFIVQARGSFYIAQYLCNRAAIHAGVFGTQARTTDVPFGPTDIFPSIQDELAADYRTPLLHLAAFDSVTPPRGAGLSLLWLLTRSPNGFVSIREAELRFPKLKPVFDWFLQSNLSSCFEQHSDLRGLLYFNRATGTLTMEDPRLDFYLRNLDWREFALASGHGHVEFHPDDGPLWPIEGTGSFPLDVLVSSGPGTVSAPVRRLLHLSDLHFASPEQAMIAYSQLAEDLRQQGIDRLDAVVISGDLVNRATVPEYEVAGTFLEQLKSGFGVKAQAIALVPGNHDVSWSHSRAAYSLVKRSELREPPAPGTYFEHTSEIIEARDEDKYRLRFAPFAELYERVTGEVYPLTYEDQATLTSLPDLGLLILGLNSAWEIDHLFRDRASIHMGALSKRLLALPPPRPDELRIATFHHPLHSNEESRIRDGSFLQRLAVAGFRLILHGHVHRAATTTYHYDLSADGRQLQLVTAGTFGAPVREWVPGYPLQYNLLLIGADAITVETRRRAEVNGAWGPDAIWLQGSGKDPLPRYVIPR